jgi:putative ubiquitin-RnfH superfamily antitoxin RatB of RatAB toxin-antitoxin module
MQVEVVYALPERQYAVAVTVAHGATIGDAIAAANFAQGLPHIDMSAVRVGVFGDLADPATPVKDGDRVEIYRPLQVDPMKARRRRAAIKATRKNTRE